MMLLACEDTLSEILLRRIVGSCRPDITISQAIGLRGKGYLKNKARELNDTARKLPVFLLVDQDSPQECPTSLGQDWFRGPPERLMLFRVAVMEVESWILADRENCSRYLMIPLNRIPTETDTISDPKQFLVNLARRSRSKTLRSDIVPAMGSSSSVGPGYSASVAQFLHCSWDVNNACEHSTSLRRAVNRLRTAFCAS